jgi:hypothetical protein
MAELPTLALQLSFDDADPVYLDRQTRQLQADLTALGIPADRVRGEAPDGARGAAEMAGLLQVVVAIAPTVTGRLFDLLKEWLGTRKSSGAKMMLKWGDQQVDVSTLTPERIATLIETLRGDPTPPQ